MDCIKSQNQFVNTVVFPGSMIPATYKVDHFNDHSSSTLLYIPYQGSCHNKCSFITAAPSSIPALLVECKNTNVKRFAIHFHGNACDVGQIWRCGDMESRALGCHYLIVEYPRFGISDGHPNELVMNEIAKTVYSFVTDKLNVPSSEIILIGRSIGSGPVCTLASSLEIAKTPVACVILQSPYTSLRDVASDVLGCFSNFMLNRWENWRSLIGNGAGVIKSPVLFIHADHDKIINCSHSKLLHQHRLQHGLPSELYIQESNELMTKGHNIFEYHKDVIVPSQKFLNKHLSLPLKPGPLLSREAIAQASIIPDLYRKRFCPQMERIVSDKYDNPLIQGEVPREINVSNPSAAFNHNSSSSSCEDILYARGKHPCAGTAACGWSLCLCVFCLEGGCAITSRFSSECYYCATCSQPAFHYTSLRPEDVTERASCWNIFHLDRFDDSAAPQQQQQKGQSNCSTGEQKDDSKSSSTSESPPESTQQRNPFYSGRTIGAEQHDNDNEVCPLSIQSENDIKSSTKLNATQEAESLKATNVHSPSRSPKPNSIRPPDEPSPKVESVTSTPPSSSALLGNSSVSAQELLTSARPNDLSWSPNATRIPINCSGKSNTVKESPKGPLAAIIRRASGNERQSRLHMENGFSLFNSNDHDEQELHQAFEVLSSRERNGSSEDVFLSTTPLAT